MPSDPEPKFSAGSVRLTVFAFLDSRSGVEPIENGQTLSDLGVAKDSVRAFVNSTFFPAPHKGLSGAQVSEGTSVLQLIITINNKLDSQGRLKP